MINSIIGRMLKNCVGSFNQIVLILHEKNESLFLKTLRGKGGVPWVQIMENELECLGDRRGYDGH